MRGLADLYNTNPEFIRNFQQFHEHLPAYLQQVIPVYVDALEDAELARLLADDDAQAASM
jgi:hypothetical protein